MFLLISGIGSAQVTLPPGSPLNMFIERAQDIRLRPGSRSPGDEKTYSSPDKRQFSGISPVKGPEAARRKGWGRGDGGDGRKGLQGCQSRSSKEPGSREKHQFTENAQEQEETSPQSAAILSRQSPRVTNGLRWGVSACECAYHVHGATTGDTETVEWQQVVPNSCQDRTGDFMILHTWASAPAHFHRRSPSPDRVTFAF